jgi:hypothetical protein
MPQFNSADLLHQLEEDIRLLQRITEQEFMNLTDHQLLHTPSPDQWSIAQCLEHLNSYGQYYLPRLEHVIQTGEQQGISAKAVFSSGWLGHYFAQSMKPGADGSIGLKMKAVKNHSPLSQLDTRAVLDEFSRQQTQLINLLRRAKQVDIGRLRIPISIASWIRLSLGDTFRFLVAHEQRHALQAQNIRRTIPLDRTDALNPLATDV